MKILALDPATNFGWAHSSGMSGVWDLSVRPDESGGMRLIRLRAKLAEILASVGVDVVFFEAQRGGMPGRLGALVVQSEIQGVVKLWCEDSGIQYRGVSPGEIKKHATGKGNSNKEKMLEAAQVRWPGIKFESDDHADAMWLLDLAQKMLGERQAA